MGFNKQNQMDDEPEDYYNVDRVSDRESDRSVHVGFDQQSTASTTETESKARDDDMKAEKARRLKKVLIIVIVIIVIVILIVVAVFLALYFIRGGEDTLTGESTTLAATTIAPSGTTRYRTTLPFYLRSTTRPTTKGPTVRRTTIPTTRPTTTIPPGFGK